MQGEFLQIAPCHSLFIDLDRTMKSPQILELSGVGNPEVLNRIKVPTKINLPGVGENVQDHVLAGASFGDNYISCASRPLSECTSVTELKDDPSIETLDILSDPAMIAEHVKLQYVFSPDALRLKSDVIT